MNIAVFLFFLHNVLATFFLGMKFKGRQDRALKFFGFALLLNAVAFAVWTFGIIRPENLLISVTIGAIIFLASLVFFLSASLQKAQPTTRLLLTGLGVVAVLVIFYVGHIDPATAYISSEGFFFFNLGPLMQMLYIFALALATLPAVDAVASKFTSPYSVLLRYGFIAEVVGGIMLITSKDTQVLYVVGWIIGLVYLLLWTTFLFNKKAWSEN